MEKKMYAAPEAEVLTFAKEDVITSSRDWELPSIGLGGGDGDWNWSEDGDFFNFG